MTEQQVTPARSGVANRTGATENQQATFPAPAAIQINQAGPRPNMNVLMLRHDSGPAASGYVLVQQSGLPQGTTAVIRPGVNVLGGQQILVRAPAAAQFTNSPAQQIAASGSTNATTFVVQTGNVATEFNGTASSDSTAASTNAKTPQRGAGANNVSNELIVKCNQFFNTLLQLASQQSKATHEAVRNLAQTLIDGKINAQTFTARLQEQLNSTPQPNLVPFLEKTLPAFRQQLINGSMSVDGIKAPGPDSKASSALSPGSGHNGVEGEGSTSASSKSHDKLSDTFSAVISDSAASTPRTPSPAAATSRAASSRSSRPSSSGRKTLRGAAAASAAAKAASLANAAAAASASGSSASATAASANDRDRSRLGEDDEAEEETLDNLMEEKQAGGAAASITFTARSFRDDAALNLSGLRRRTTELATRAGLDGVGDAALQLLANAVQQRLQRVLEQLAVVAEHRLELYARDGRFEPLPGGDAKASFKTLEDADRLEQLRHAKEQEQSLLRAAKSRTKTDDPDQAKLKQKAKELAQAQLEEKKQQAANLTALAAIAGTRKQRKFDDSSAAAVQEAPLPTVSASPSLPAVRPLPTTASALRGNEGALAAASSLAAGSTITRLKRATMKDLLFVLEQSPGYAQSKLLCRLALK